MRTAGGAGFGMPGDAEAMARQWMNAFGDAMRAFGGQPQAPQDPWQATFDTWSRMAGVGRRDEAADMVERFSMQARQWLGMMQQVAGQFAGRDASPTDIASAWKQAMGGQGSNPFAALFEGMAGRGQAGFEQWHAQAAPMINAMMGSMLMGGLRQEGLGLLRLPAFGMNREHQERLQALAAAQIELQERNDAYNQLMLGIGQDAFVRFERKLSERSEPGRQLKSARALFDLWIDAAEEAYAEVALSQEFRKRYGELVNAQMKVRAGIQREVELFCDLFGMPGRTEVDAAHRRIAELERQVRRLRNATPQAQPKQGPAKPVTAPTAAKDAAKASSQLADKPVAPSKAKPAARVVAKAASKTSTRAKAAKSAVKAKPLRAAAKRAPKPAIASIALPEPLKPIAAAKSPSKTTKRAR
ncbi:MAG: class III poly(R)-hydroxyalkanoic acid synthase subunit PhaE [Xanthomonadaceae bacterium]|nr:class III poly(R)-hydroxyalkanoic acid synthase subunit PhaE [Xanthomonadaceae bacterium]